MEGNVLARRKDGKFITYDGGQSVSFAHAKLELPIEPDELAGTLKLPNAHKPLRVKIHS
jgi:hypothetical protein